MNHQQIKQCWQQINYECEQHQRRMLYAASQMQGFMPLTPTHYQMLGDNDIAMVDQFVYRFSKMQDAMGAKLFPILLQACGEDIEKLFYLDRLAKLEKLGVLDEQKWLALREERNQIAHEYPETIPEVVAALNHVFELHQQLLTIYQDVKNRFNKVFVS